MSDQDKRSASGGADADIRRLMQLAGPRKAPPAEVAERVRAAVLAEFDVLSEQLEPGVPPRRIARTWTWAVAASLLLVLGLGYLVSRDAPPPPGGRILYASGGYTIRGSNERVDRVPAGSIVQTSGGGRLLVDLGDERTLRIDQGSSLTLHSDSEIWLHSGRLYIDAAGGDPVVVVTPYSSVTDLGTQFEVRVDGESMSVATREGRVTVRLGERQIQSAAEPGRAEELSIQGHELVLRRTVPTTGERWHWTQVSRPLFPVLDRSLAEYLRWAARESGRQLTFASGLAEQQAALRLLAGQGEVDADRASVQRVLAATAFSEQAGEPHELIVGLRAQ